MNFLAWNIRGAGTRIFPSLIRDLVGRHKLSLLLLVETRYGGSKADQIIKKIGFPKYCKVDANGFAGGFWLLWDNSMVDVEILETHKQFIHARISSRPGQASWFFTGAYGSPQGQLREELGTSLRELAEKYKGPWMLMGDFNSYYGFREEWWCCS